MSAPRSASAIARTGVSDDEELDRISDYDCSATSFAALGAGRPIAVAWMKGRSRAFTVSGAPRSARSALSVGFNDRCDAIIATAVHGAERSADDRAGRAGILEQQDR